MSSDDDPPAKSNPEQPGVFGKSKNSDMAGDANTAGETEDAEFATKKDAEFEALDAKGVKLSRVIRYRIESRFATTTLKSRALSEIESLGNDDLKSPGEGVRFALDEYSWGTRKIVDRAEKIANRLIEKGAREVLIMTWELGHFFRSRFGEEEIKLGLRALLCADPDKPVGRPQSCPYWHALLRLAYMGSLLIKPDQLTRMSQALGEGELCGIKPTAEAWIAFYKDKGGYRGLSDAFSERKSKDQSDHASSDGEAEYSSMNPDDEPQFFGGEYIRPSELADLQAQCDRLSPKFVVKLAETAPNWSERRFEDKYGIWLIRYGGADRRQAEVLARQRGTSIPEIMRTILQNRAIPDDDEN